MSWQLLNVPGLSRQSRDGQRARRWFLQGGLLAAVVAVAGASLAVEDTSPVGLQGIYTAVPADLTADGMSAPEGKWAEFAQQTAAEAETFYKAEGDVTAQRAALEALKQRVESLANAISTEKSGATRSILIGLHGPLARRVDLAEAVLATLTDDPDARRERQVRSQAKAIATGETALKGALARVKNGSAWIKYLKSAELLEALNADPFSDAAMEAARLTETKLARRDVQSGAKEDIRKFLSRPEFLAFEKIVKSYLAAVTAPVGADAAVAVRTHLTQLVAAVEEYELSSTKTAGQAIRDSYRNLQPISVVGNEQVGAVLRKHYFNYNLRVNASEAFLSKLLSESRVESSGVVDNILGANVGGSQTTSSRVGVDLKPSSDRIRFDVTLNGVVQSSTAGVTSEATVYTSGYHTFYATKEVFFDGQNFATAPARIGVRANNTTTGIATRYSGGLFGGIADRVASQEVAARRGAAEAIAASRVQQRVQPRFDAEVSSSFTKAGQRLKSELYSGLKKANLYPQTLKVASTSSKLMVRSRLMDRVQVGASTPHPMLAEGLGTVALLHESLLNNSLEQLDIAGKTLTDEEFKAKLQSFLSTAAGRPIKFKQTKTKAKVAEGTQSAEDAESEDEAEQGPSTFMFAEQDPLRVQVGNGALTLILKTGFRQEGKDDIPVQEIRVPLIFKVNKSKIQVTRGNIVVTGDVGIATRGVIRKKIQTSLPERELSSRLEVRGADKTVPTWIREIQMVDGWVKVRIN